MPLRKGRPRGPAPRHRGGQRPGRPADALLAALAAASFDVERQDGPGSLRALCAFHRRDEAYVLHRKATLWAAETHEYVQVHCLPRLDAAAWERIRDGALAWGRARIRPHDEHMASYVSVIILCRTWHQDAAAALARCRVRKSFWLGLRGWMRLARWPSSCLPRRGATPSPMPPASATRQPGHPAAAGAQGRSRPFFLASVHHEFPVSAPWRPGPAGLGYFVYGAWLGKGLGASILPVPRLPTSSATAWTTCPPKLRWCWATIFVHRRGRAHQRPHPGRRLRLAALLHLGGGRRHLLRRRA